MSLLRFFLNVDSSQCELLLNNGYFSIFIHCAIAHPIYMHYVTFTAREIECKLKSRTLVPLIDHIGDTNMAERSKKPKKSKKPQ